MSRKDKFKRQCSVCREYKDKNDLIRITKNFQNNEAEINENSLVFGRSVYVCKNQDCIEKFIKQQKIKSQLKVTATDDVVDKLYSFLKNSTL